MSYGHLPSILRKNHLSYTISWQMYGYLWTGCTVVYWQNVPWYVSSTICINSFKNLIVKSSVGIARTYKLEDFFTITVVQTRKHNMSYPMALLTLRWRVTSCWKYSYQLTQETEAPLGEKSGTPYSRRSPLCKSKRIAYNNGQILCRH